MVKKTGMNGIAQTTIDNTNNKMMQLAALIDYVAMMGDVDIPTEEEMNNEQEA